MWKSRILPFTQRCDVVEGRIHIRALECLNNSGHQIANNSVFQPIGGIQAVGRCDIGRNHSSGSVEVLQCLDLQGNVLDDGASWNSSGFQLTCGVNKELMSANLYISCWEPNSELKFRNLILRCQDSHFEPVGSYLDPTPTGCSIRGSFFPFGANWIEPTSSDGTFWIIKGCRFPEVLDIPSFKGSLSFSQYEVAIACVVKTGAQTLHIQKGCYVIEGEELIFCQRESLFDQGSSAINGRVPHEVDYEEFLQDSLGLKKCPLDPDPEIAYST